LQVGSSVDVTAAEGQHRRQVMLKVRFVLIALPTSGDLRDGDLRTAGHELARELLGIEIASASPSAVLNSIT